MLALLFASLFSAAAQDLDLGGATLEDLLNVKTAVASKTQLSARATPGIVTIISDEEIHNMGARDLIDVLSLVPSISFGNDVQGVVGMGIRGMWAHEGKFLLLVDGIEMNELQYGTTHFGNEFPVSQIKRIEIVRGPGSAIYGGFAEQAVVNIVTKSGADLNGADAHVTYGKMAGGSERLNYALSGGKQSGDWVYSAAGFMGQAARGEGKYTGFDPNTPAYGSFDYKDSDRIKPAYANLGVSNGAFNFRFIWEEYEVTTGSMFNFTGIDRSIPNIFRSYNLLASYDFKWDKLKLTPQVQFNYQNPWLQNSEEAFQIYRISDVRSVRTKSGLTAAYDFNDSLNLLAGYEYYNVRHNLADQRDTTGPIAFRSGKDFANFASSATFAQALYQSDLFNITVGARYEDPNFTKSSFVPRAGITRAEKDWHAKMLYAQAFRTPVLYNIDARPGIQPEKAETAEIEYGHSITANSYLTANIFNTKIEDPIVYYYDNTLGDQYDNFGEVGTRGLELDYRWKPAWGQLQLAYSLYEVNHNDVAKYKVTADRDALFGMPQHKAVLNSWIKAGAHNKINPGLLFIGDRYAYEFDGGSGTMLQRKSSATVVANLFYSREDLWLKGLSGGLGVFNLFDQDVRFIQPYDGGHSPAPGPSREFTARLEYHF